MFNEEKQSPDVEKDLKVKFINSLSLLQKLLTLTKSKFYMLRVNYPKAFEKVDYEIEDSQNTDPNHEHDPFATTP